MLHDVLGTGVSAHVLSTIYLWFLPLVPLALAAWLVWSRNISFGYWFATSQSIAWSLGTASYYALPTLGPGFQYAWLYKDLPDTGLRLMERSSTAGRMSCCDGADEGSCSPWPASPRSTRHHPARRADGAVHAAQPVAHRVFWVNFAITVVATLYFGWHYVADDIAGAVIALFAFYLGGIASGQKFDRRGLASHPTTTTSRSRSTPRLTTSHSATRDQSLVTRHRSSSHATSQCPRATSQESAVRWLLSVAGDCSSVEGDWWAVRTDRSGVEGDRSRGGQGRAKKLGGSRREGDLLDVATRPRRLHHHPVPGVERDVVDRRRARRGAPEDG